jgi:hypothetical protein
VQWQDMVDSLPRFASCLPPTHAPERARRDVAEAAEHARTNVGGTGHLSSRTWHLKTQGSPGGMIIPPTTIKIVRPPQPVIEEN